MGPPILWQKQIQRIEYGLDDTIKIWKKERRSIDTLLIYTSDTNFQTIWMPKVILANFLSQKAGPLGPFLFLKKNYINFEYIHLDHW